MEDQIKQLVEGIIAVADKERKQSKPYKDMFKKTKGKPFCVQLQDVNSEMVNVVLNYTSILKENGFNVTNETFKFLLALPILAHILEEDIVAKDGRVCCVDKTYRLLHQELYKLLEIK